MEKKDNYVGGIMVLYNPNWAVTNIAIESLASQVDLLCIIDNTPNEDVSAKFTNISNIKYIPLKENRGIAAAQNIGIQYLTVNSYDFVIFSDQDSVSPPDIVDCLLREFKTLTKVGYKIGLIGPMAINKNTRQPYENKKKYIREIEIDNSKYIESQSIISSFSLIPLRLFQQIGLFREELFIDFVENEWCFRLKYKSGLSAFISKQASILHELGTSRRFLGKQISISSPFRLYFQIRNFLWVKNLPQTPIEWKKQVWGKLILKLIYYPIIPSNRMAYVKSIFKAIKDGQKNKILN